LRPRTSACEALGQQARRLPALGDALSGGGSRACARLGGAGLERSGRAAAFAGQRSSGPRRELGQQASQRRLAGRCGSSPREACRPVAAASPVRPPGQRRFFHFYI